MKGEVGMFLETKERKREERGGEGNRKGKRGREALPPIKIKAFPSS
jgi:hypothetical protein